MSRTEYRLFAALLISLFIHALPFLPTFNFGQNFESTVAPLIAELRPHPAAEASPPPLKLPEPAPVQTAPPVPAKPQHAAPLPDKAPTPWTQVVRQHLKKLDATGQFYPAEAIAQGLEGEVQVLLIIDEAGKVSAARVEQGSGHPLLDAAALNAVRTLTSLPADAPRQMILPVRFKLN